ncbi:MAG: cation diffusion facilitator family transporter [Bacteroidota bacterium]|nr:cation transporter [Flavisolibacter sp.]MBD0286675.1 cation transporter [Flavisolibacter sp.]MBD0297800.1 cation transporter [Flavisolibacter sp.]MBD0367451.1 cation transporter [Flavisolibacter sp.]MDQ3843350.1 cation diffusion facilitator family transporter [Bacteroidota bacterium]
MKATAQQQKQNNLRLQLWIAIASAILLIAKFVGYFITNSVSILTDALESIVNVAAALIGLYSLYISAKPRDINHPYGHGKAEFVSAAIEGTLVLSAGAIIVYKGIKNFIVPEPIHQVDTGIYLIAGTAIVNWLLGYITLQQGKRNNSLALIASGKHLQSDSYSTFAIIAGLVIITITGWVWVDPLVAFIFGIVIIVTGYKIVRKSIAGIMDEADMLLLGKMVDVLNRNRRDNWVDLHNLRVIKYGNVLHVDCHLTVPWYLNIAEAHTEIDYLTQLIRNDFGESLEVFVHSDGCRYFQCHLCNKNACPVRQHPFKKEIIWTLNNVLENKQHSWEDVLEHTGEKSS